MSLFKVREWWRGAAGSSEDEFDRGSLVVGNVDNNPDREDKIVVGSLSGMLRVYKPTGVGERVEDLLYEEDLGAPVLQLEVGRLADKTKLSLAVLHPLKLAVYTLSPGKGGAYVVLEREYQHSLGHTSANMAIGPFGGASHDSVCVQSFDGELTVFEQGASTLVRHLRGFLLPGPLAYVSGSDSLCTCTSAFELESYSYAALVAATEDDRSADEKATHLTRQKKVQPEWRVTIGQPAIELRALQGDSEGRSGSQLLALGEDTLFAFSENGVCLWQMRFTNFTPSCLWPYEAPQEKGNSKHHLLIGTSTGSLMVYQQKDLLWAAKNIEPFIACRLGSFAGQKGLIVLLSEQGTLTANYLGTDPPLSSVSNVEAKELNYEEMDEEHNRLLSIIRQATSEKREDSSEAVILHPQPPSEARLQDPQGLQAPAPGAAPILRVPVTVEFTGEEPLEHVHVTASVPAPFVCAEDSMTIEWLSGGEGEGVTLSFDVFAPETELVPSSDTMAIGASYVTREGEPRSTFHRFGLPFSAFCAAVAPVKVGAHKMTIDTNRHHLPGLNDLFSDCTLHPESLAPSAVSLRHHSGDVATVVAGKSGGKLRVQADNIAALWVPCQEVCRRLREHFMRESDFFINFPEELPLDSLFERIDSHLACRQRMKELDDALAKRAHQFRAVQRRLLARYKDKNPSSLDHLTTLVEGTHAQITELDDSLSKEKATLASLRSSLLCTVRLVLFLASIRFGLSASDYANLQAHFCPTLGSDEWVQGWEEVTQSALAHLLKTGLGKQQAGSGDSSPPAVPDSFDMPQDASALKRHISSIFQRLSSGYSLS